MLLSTKHRVALLALPKTGTTSLEQALRPLCDIAYTQTPNIKHMTFRTYQRFLVPYLDAVGVDKVETFCVVREPLDWLGSWYRYRLDDRFDGTPNSAKSVDFDGFIDAYLSEDRPRFAKIGRPSKFVQARGGGVGVDRLFKYPSLPALVDALSRRFGRDLKLKRVNASPAAPLALSADRRARLEAELAEDFALYHDKCA